MKLPIIPVSVGELYDKYTILQIKNEKITDINKLTFIKKEMHYLKPFLNEFTIDNDIVNELKQINEKLWIVEDKIREKEYNKEFDNDFIELARLVYITNDERNRIKNRIDKILNSELSDIKSYVNYN
jgi:hypothetical protein